MFYSKCLWGDECITAKRVFGNYSAGGGDRMNTLKIAHMHQVACGPTCNLMHVGAFQGGHPTTPCTHANFGATHAHRSLLCCFMQKKCTQKLELQCRWRWSDEHPGKIAHMHQVACGPTCNLMHVGDFQSVHPTTLKFFQTTQNTYHN